MVIDLSLITNLAAAIIQVRGGAYPDQIAQALEDARAALQAFQEREANQPADPHMGFGG